MMAGIGKVAWREFYERVWNRGFVLSTLFTVLMVVGGGVVGGFLGGGSGDSYTVGLTGEGSQQARTSISGAASASGATVQFENFDDRGVLQWAVADGEADVGVVGGQTLLADGDPGAAGALVQSAVSQQRVVQALEDSGVPTQEAQAALDPQPLEVEDVGSQQEEASAGPSFVAIGGVAILFFTIFGYGFWIANGVVEEKSSRVVEVILATVRPSELLAGKVLGIGVLGLLQLLVFGGLGLLAAVLAGIELPEATAGTVAATVVWFVLGFAFYGLLFAVAGSLVSQQEDLQYTTQPMMIVLFGGFGVAAYQFGNSEAVLAQVLAYVPPFSPLLMPLRMDSGLSSVPEVAITLLLMVGALAGMVALASRLYAGSVLRFGSHVKLKEAWRSPGRSQKAKRAEDTS